MQLEEISCLLINPSNIIRAQVLVHEEVQLISKFLHDKIPHATSIDDHTGRYLSATNLLPVLQW